MSQAIIDFLYYIFYFTDTAITTSSILLIEISMKCAELSNKITSELNLIEKKLEKIEFPRDKNIWLGIVDELYLLQKEFIIDLLISKDPEYFESEELKNYIGYGIIPKYRLTSYAIKMFKDVHSVHGDLLTDEIIKKTKADTKENPWEYSELTLHSWKSQDKINQLNLEVEDNIDDNGSIINKSLKFSGKVIENPIREGVEQAYLESNAGETNNNIKSKNETTDYSNEIAHNKVQDSEESGIDPLTQIMLETRAEKALDEIEDLVGKLKLESAKKNERTELNDFCLAFIMIGFDQGREYTDIKPDETYTWSSIEYFSKLNYEFANKIVTWFENNIKDKNVEKYFNDDIETAKQNLILSAENAEKDLPGMLAEFVGSDKLRDYLFNLFIYGFKTAVVEIATHEQITEYVKKIR